MFKSVSILPTLALALVASPSFAEEIRVLNWMSYGTDAEFAVAEFEAATGIKVVHDYFNSEQEKITKLQTGAGDYDVVLINAAMLDTVRELGLLQPLDPARISRWQDLTPAFTANEAISRDGQFWGAPWVWGVNTFAYQTEKVEGSLTAAASLWDPAFAGRIALRDDAEWQVKQAALVLGQDMNHPEDMAAIKEKLIALKPQVKLLWQSEDEWMKGIANGAFDIGQIWAGGALRAQNEYDLPVSLVIPDEGAIAWLDALAIPKDAKNPAGAAKFIDYMLSPEFYTRWDSEIGAASSTNAKAVAALPEDSFNRRVLGTPEVAEKLHFMGPLSDAERQAIQQLWAEVKTEFAR